MNKSELRRLVLSLNRSINKTHDILARIQESDHPLAVDVLAIMEDEGVVYAIDMSHVLALFDRGSRPRGQGFTAASMKDALITPLPLPVVNLKGDE